MEVITLGRSGGSGGRSGGGSFGRSGGGSFGGSRGGGGRSGGLSGGFGLGRGASSGQKRGAFGGTSGGMFGGSRNTSTGFGNVRPPIFYGGGFGRGFGRPRRTGGLGCGCLTWIIVFILLIIVLSFMFNMNTSSSKQENITVSSEKRVALPPGSVNETKYFTDELGWIENETKLLAGMKNFYKLTGVQPYLYITDTINNSHYPTRDELEIYANNLYDELFTDEAHLLLVFFEYDGRYMDWYVAGTQAKSVVDTEAGNILLDYIDRYYYESNLNDEEFFSKSFNDAADRIMKVTRSPWSTVFIVIGIVVLVIVLFVWWKKFKEQKELEAKRREEILNTPLEKFGETETDELLKKYEDEK